MHWKKVEADKAKEIIESVERIVDKGLFLPVATEILCAHLPFYRNLALYRLTNHAMLPAFTMDFIGDGHHFYLMDGTARPIFQANTDHGFHLTEDTVIDYIDFFLRSVALDEGEAYVIFSRDTAKFIDSLAHEDRKIMEDQKLTPVISCDEAANIFNVSCCLYLGGTLVDSTLNVSRDGRVDIRNTSMIIRNVPRPFAESPYAARTTY